MQVAVIGDAPAEWNALLFEVQVIFSWLSTPGQQPIPDA